MTVSCNALAEFIAETLVLNGADLEGPPGWSAEYVIENALRAAVKSVSRKSLTIKESNHNPAIPIPDWDLNPGSSRRYRARRSGV